MKKLSLFGWRAMGCALLLVTTLAPAACRRFEYVSMRPLDDVGFSFSSEQQLQQLDPTKEEVAELVKAVKGGVSEAACVDLVRIARGHKRHFAEGDAVAALRAAGISDATIVELARLRQIASWAGEAQAIRLTGTSERVIVAVAERRAAGQPVPAGASLARMKDSGVSEASIVELVNRGLTDSGVDSVVWRKKHGWKDEQILKDFPPKP
jgi:hypothetical protein